MRGVACLAASLLVLSAGQGLQRTLADELHVQIHPESVGPFPGGVGGQIPYTISVEIVDVESDGYDSQGVGGISWDVFTDTGAAPPVSGPALTGESGIYGPARADMYRYEWTNGPDEMFIGGYGFESPGAFSGSSVVDDDLMDVWAALPLSWIADVEPNVPGLQPEAMAGIGISERPAGGAWVLAEGFLNYPAEPGIYTIDVLPTIGVFILPDLDLSQDYASEYRDLYAPEQLIGDSFSFVVLPEPGAFAILALGFLLCRRR